MKKKRKTNIITAFLLTLVLAFSLPSYAATTQEQIESTQQENEKSEEILASTQERLAALEAQKDDSQNYLNELTSQLSELTQSMETLQQQYSEKSEQLAEIEKELEAAREDEAEQYEAMKLRIQYLYEESTSAGLLEALFSTDGFMEFLNRADAYKQITEYDRQMLEEYSDTIETIEEKETQAEQEKAEIEALQAEEQEQQEQIQQVYENAYNELREIELSIEDSQSEEARLVAQIEEQETKLNELIAQKYAEEAAAAEAAAQAQAAAEAAAAAAASGSGSSSTSSISVSASVSSSGSTSSDSASSGNLTYLGKFKLTAYCGCSKCCGKYASVPVITASGAGAVQGVTVAMGGVSFGTKLSINGHVYTVQDRGTSYGHVDIYFTTHAAACAFGMTYADVYRVD